MTRLGLIKSLLL